MRRSLTRFALGLWLCLASLLATDCAPRSRPVQLHTTGPPSGSPLRFRVRVGEDRLSPVIKVAVPAHSRSITIVAEGAPDVLYALASFKLGGVELQDFPQQALAEKLHAAYFVEGSAQPPGSLLQFSRLGTFTFLYPYAPEQPLFAGPLEFRIAASRAEGDVDITVLLPEDDGASVLHLNLLVVSEEHDLPLDAPPAFLPTAQAIFAQAGISLRIDAIAALRDSGLSAVATLSLPWESPSGPLSHLTRLGQKRVESAGLPIYLVDALPRGSDGTSLGLPGPPLPQSSFFGVVLRRAEPQALGRTLSHEVAHFLGLRHVRTVTASGAVLTDGIADTEPAGDNLMEHGDRLSSGQIKVLRRSPLLTLH